MTLQSVGLMYEWFKERVEIQYIADDVLTKHVPVHVNILYCLGGVVLCVFIIQLATGFSLTLWYVPTVANASLSVEYLLSTVSFGWFVRALHRWTSSVMVIALFVHVLRVYLTNGFKKLRELIWHSGMIL